MSDTSSDMVGASDSDLSRYRFRRWLFIACTTAASLAMMFLLAWFKTGSVVETAVGALSAIIQTLLVTYLGASVLDRSGILQGVGDRMRGTPPQAPAT